MNKNRIRLNKYLSRAGLGSRRKVEDLIQNGKIQINGQKIQSLAITVDPDTDTVTCNGKPLKIRTDYIYLIFNKPAGYLTTMSDDKNRPTVMDLIPEKYRLSGVFPVGRLDKETEGLLLFTNDGDFAHSLNHPDFKVTKEYLVELNKPLEDDAKKKIESGLFLHQLKIKTKPARINFTAKNRKHLLITISEGKKRQIRYSFKNLGYRVVYLKRITYGSLSIKGVKKGSCRRLKKDEVNKLKKVSNKSN